MKSFYLSSSLYLTSPLLLSPSPSSGPSHSPFLNRTREVTLTNFVLSKHLVRDGDELMDQRGSLAYVSPDVLSGKWQLSECEYSPCVCMDAELNFIEL